MKVIRNEIEILGITPKLDTVMDSCKPITLSLCWIGNLIPSPSDFGQQLSKRLCQVTTTAFRISCFLYYIEPLTAPYKLIITKISQTYIFK
jgi:hypothetical protein